MDYQADLFDLLARACNGCPEAKLELFERYSDAIRRTIRRRLSRPMRTHMDSSDLMQEARIKLLSSAFSDEVFESPDRFLAYVRKLGLNEVRQAHRRLRNKLEAELQLAYCDVPSAELPPEFAMEHEDSIKFLLKKLPPPCAVLLRRPRWLISRRGCV